MLRKALKIILILVSLAIVGVAILLIYLKFALPNVGEPEQLTVEVTPSKLERGEYLANHVMLCMDCHSQRDWSTYAGPPIAGTLGQGGEVFDQDMGFPGKFVASNITPYNLKDWTDGEVFRAITAGVGKDGRALFPIMPHHNYGQLDRSDIECVIAYVRSLNPVEHQTDASSADFPMNFIMNTIPQKPSFSTMPTPGNTAEYGKYVITASGCYDCHTNQEKGQFIGEPYAGGMNFQFPDGTSVVSANITPHEQGIGSWNEEQFVRRFKMYQDSGFVLPKIKSGTPQTVMPWSMYAGMTETDLRAIFTYLKTVAPKPTVH